MADQWQLRAQLDRILKSNTFSHSERLRKFLSYVVVESIEGRGHKIKSYVIGIEALDRSNDFDVAHDGIVRTTANRLRSALEKYYLTEGRNDPIVISLPKGRYIPDYKENPTAEPCDDKPGLEMPAPVEVAKDSVPTPPTSKATTRRVLTYAATAVLLVAVTAFGALRFGPNNAVARWRPPAILIQATTTLTDDERAVLFARSLPVRLSGAMAFYDINSVVRPANSIESYDYTNELSDFRSVYIVTSEVGSDASGLFVYWQLVDAGTGAVLWSSRIAEQDGYIDDRFVEVMVHELVGEDAVIRSAERRKLPVEPVAGYVCVTHSFNKMTTITETDRAWMSACLAATVAEQPDYAVAWALLALVRIEDSITAADRGQSDVSQALLEDGWRSFLNAQRLAPGFWFTLRAKILIEFQKQDFESFRSSTSEALRLLPQNARERVAIGSRLFALGDYEQAERVIRETTALMTLPQPSDYLFLAACLYHNRQYADALRLLQDQPIPDSTFYWSLLAAIAARLDDSPSAANAIRSLEELRPNFLTILELDLVNRHFRDEFIVQIMSDFDMARRMTDRT